MEVNKLESKEVLVMLFGLPVMITLIVLVSIGVGHWVTTRSDRPTNVNVTAAQPRVDVNVPAAAPQIQVTAAPPKIDVNVPQAAAPNVNVTTPPATVTVLDRRSDGDTHVETKPEKPEKKETARPAEPVKPAAPAPAAPKTEQTPKTSSLVPIPVKAAVSDDEMSLETLYSYAEKYIDSYCRKNNLDAALEAKKWQNAWKRNLDQAVSDNIDSSEQTYINRIVVAKRNCFDIEKATPEQIVEGCRIMLRYRDGQLAWLQAMKDAVTNENMKKTLVFLAAGVR